MDNREFEGYRAIYTHPCREKEGVCMHGYRIVRKCGYWLERYLDLPKEVVTNTKVVIVGHKVTINGHVVDMVRASETH